MNSISKEMFLRLPAHEQTSRETLEKASTHTLLEVLLVPTVSQEARQRVADYLLSSRLSYDANESIVNQEITLENYAQADLGGLSLASAIDRLRPDVLLAMLLQPDYGAQIKQQVFQSLCARFSIRNTQPASIWTRTEEGTSTASIPQEDLSALRRFHWGAFFLAPLWCLFNGKAGTGILMMFINLLARIPVLGIIFLICNYLIAYVIGTSAYEHLWEKRKNKYGTMEQLIASQRGWVIVGCILGSLIAIYNIFAVISVISAISSGNL
jgi:hypothetical protein